MLSKALYIRSFNLLLLIVLLWSRTVSWANAKEIKSVTLVSTNRQEIFSHSSSTINLIPDSITAASSDIEVELIDTFDNLDGIVGVEVNIKFFASEFVVDSYTLSGNLPPGLRLSLEINEFGVGTIQGIPTQEGLYLVNVTGWEEPGGKGNSSTPLSLLFEIISKGPNITKQPSNTIVDWGQPGSIKVEVENLEGVSFRWFKDLIELEGETGPSLSYDRASYNLNGTYRVEAIGTEGKSFSEDAFFFVRATPYQRYLENNYENPFLPELSNTADFDRDSFQNQIEVALGSDLADSRAKPIYQFEVMEEGDRTITMLTHSISQNLINSQIQIEVSEDLSSDSWEKLNVTPEEAGNQRTYTWISTRRQFIRIVIVD